MTQQLAPRDTSDLRLVISSDKIREQLLAALPKAYSAEQFTVIVRTAINRNPKLMECDQSSFLTAMLTAAQMGIAPDGRNGHLIPRFNKKSGKMEASFQPDYKGLVKLVRQNENVTSVYAEPVYDNDIFQIKKGLHRDLVHEVDVRKPRGEFIGVYAVIAYKDSAADFEFMSKEEVEGIRKRSQSPDYGPWATDYSEMAKKTVIKRLLKLADLSPEIADRIAHDPEGLTEIRIAPAAVHAASDAPIRQALPEPFQEEQLTEDSLPQSEPVAFPSKTQKSKKPKAAQPEVQVLEDVLLDVAPEQATPTLLDSIREKLSEFGKTEGDLIKICITEKWIKDGEALENLTETAKTSILTYWGEILEALN
jgi:recombination protein RecT